MPSVILKFLTTRVAKTFAKKTIWEAMEKDFLQKIRTTIGTASDGSRAWPKRTEDKKLGIRLDWGEKFQKDGEWYRNLVLQANKDAENQAINEVAKKGTHDKRAVIAVPMSADGKELHEDVTLQDFMGVTSEGI